MNSAAKPITIVGIPVHARDRSHIDQIIKFIGHNLRGADRSHFKVIVDTNGMSQDLNNYLNVKLAVLKKQLDVVFVPHSEPDGRTASMNRIANRALADEGNLNGVIYMNDNIVLEADTLKQLAEAITTQGIVGAHVTARDISGEQSRTLAERAISDFELRVRCKAPHMHGALFAMSGTELRALQHEGGLPPVHFEDTYLIVREKMRHNSADYQILVLKSARASFSVPVSYEAAITKIAGYAAGDQQLVAFFEHAGHPQVAALLQSACQSEERAQQQFSKCFEAAKQAAQGLPAAKGVDAEIQYIMRLWHDNTTQGVPMTALPDEREIEATLGRLVVGAGKDGSYSMRAPEVVLPLINSMLNLMGVRVSASPQLSGSSWKRYEIPFPNLRPAVERLQQPQIFTSAIAPSTSHMSISGA